MKKATYAVLGIILEGKKEVLEIYKVYTTHVIEYTHRQLRKVTKSNKVLPTDSSLLKQLYLVVAKLDKKWDRSFKRG